MKKNTIKVLSGALTAATVFGTVPAMASTPKPSNDAELSAIRAVIKLNNTKGILELLDAQKQVNALPNGEFKAFLLGEIKKQVPKVYNDSYVAASKQVIKSQGSLYVVDAVLADQLIAKVTSKESKAFLKVEMGKVYNNVYTEDFIPASRAVTAYRTVARDAASTGAEVEAARTTAAELVEKVVNVQNKEFLAGEITKIDADIAPISIIGAKALNGATIEVDLSKEATEDISIANFSINNGAEIDTVEINGTKAILNLTNAVQSGEEYTVTFNENGNVSEATFVYETAEIASIELTKTKFQEGEDLKDFVAVKDAEGRDITSEVKDSMTINTTNENVVDKDGVAQKKGTARISISANRPGEDEFTSSTIAVTVEAVIIKGIDGYNFTNGEALTAEKYTEKKENNELKTSLSVSEESDGYRLDVYGINSKDEIQSIPSSEVTYSSANPTVLSIDKDGIATPLSAGTAKITVKVSGVTKVFTITVQEKAIVSSMSFDLTKVNLVPSDSSMLRSGRESQSVATSTLTMKDQYGEEVKLADDASVGNVENNTEYKTADGGKIKITGIDEKIATVTVDKDGNFKVSATKEIGKFTLTAQYFAEGATKASAKASFDVVVNKAGTDVKEYVAESDRSLIDANDTKEDKSAQVANLELYAIDDLGNVRDLDTTDGEVKFELAEEVKGLKIVDSALTFEDEVKDTFTATGTATVNAYYKSKTSTDFVLVSTLKVDYTNTASVATLATITKSKITLSQGKVAEDLKTTTDKAITLDGILNGAGKLISSIVTIKDQNGQVITEGALKITDAKFAVNNVNNVKVNGANKDLSSAFQLIDDSKSGSVEIVLTEAYVNGKNILDAPTVITLTITK